MASRLTPGTVFFLSASADGAVMQVELVRHIVPEEAVGHVTVEDDGSLSMFSVYAEHTTTYRPDRWALTEAEAREQMSRHVNQLLPDSRTAGGNVLPFRRRVLPFGRRT